jgi:hypothetical protein
MLAFCFDKNTKNTEGPLFRIQFLKIHTVTLKQV